MTPPRLIYGTEVCFFHGETTEGRAGRAADDEAAARQGGRPDRLQGA